MNKNMTLEEACSLLDISPNYDLDIEQLEKNYIEKLYKAFKEDGIYYQPSFVSGNLDILLRGF